MNIGALFGCFFTFAHFDGIFNRRFKAFLSQSVSFPALGVIFAVLMASQPSISPDISTSQQEEVLLENDLGFQLVVWNDDVNTFEWVITTLIEICKHTEEQAEQCALIIHMRGKYGVKQGDFESLKPMCEAIIDRGINATIEEVAL